MRVVIDARMVGPVLHGFGRYVSMLGLGLSQIHKKNPLPYELIFITHPSVREFFGFETLSVDAPFLNPKEWIEIPALLNRSEAKLFHSPTFMSLPFCPIPWVQTIHDLNHLTYGGVFEKIYYALLLRRFASGAKQLVTVSEFSRTEISNWLKISAASIAIVPNAIDPRLLHLKSDQVNLQAEQTLKDLGLEVGKYFLCLSNNKPHKNLNTLVKAYENLSLPKWPFVLSVDEYRDREGIRALGKIPEQQSSVLLANAGGILFPSLYEGFGLPPLEAACLGVPLVVSDIAPHREVLRNLSDTEVRWLDPLNVEKWTQAMNEVQRGQIKGPSENAKKHLIDRFQVESMSAEQDQIYRKVLGL